MHGSCSALPLCWPTGHVRVGLAQLGVRGRAGPAGLVADAQVVAAAKERAVARGVLHGALVELPGELELAGRGVWLGSGAVDAEQERRVRHDVTASGRRRPALCAQGASLPQLGLGALELAECGGGGHIQVYHPSDLILSILSLILDKIVGFHDLTSLSYLLSSPYLDR